MSKRVKKRTNKRKLEVCWIDGEICSAYLEFPSRSRIVCTTESQRDGALLIDRDNLDNAIGVELLDPRLVDPDTVNELLKELKKDELTDTERDTWFVPSES